MFGDLFVGFKDVFYHPFILIWAFILTGLAFIFQILTQDIYFEIFFGTAGALAGILDVLKTNWQGFVLSIIGTLFLLFLSSMLIAYVVNNRLQRHNKFVGTVNIFGFSIFLSFLTLALFFATLFVSTNFWIAIILILLYLILLLFVMPAILMVPILLPTEDLSDALHYSWTFAKEHYGQILLVFILLAVLFYLIDIGLELFDFGLPAILVFLAVMAVLFLWAINFTFNWYYSEQNK